MLPRFIVGLILFNFWGLSSNGYTPVQPDTLIAHQYYMKASQLMDSLQYDSAMIFYEKAATPYKEEGAMDRYVNSMWMINTIRVKRLEYDTAESSLRELLPKALKWLGGQHPGIANLYTLLGRVLEKKGNFDQALANYEKGLAIRKKNPHLLKGLAESYHRLGIIWRIKGNSGQALKFLEKSLGINKEVFGDLNPNVANGYGEMATVYKNSNQYDQAMELYNRSMGILKQLYGTDHPSMGANFNGMAIIYAQTGRYTEATQYFNKLLEIDKKSLGEDHPDLARTYTNLGILNEIIGDYNEALKLHHKSLKIKLKSLGAEHPSVRYDYMSLGMIYNAKKDLDQALLFIQKALQLGYKSLGEMHPTLGSTHVLIGSIYSNQGEFDKALQHYKKSEKILLASGENRRTLGPNYHQMASIYHRNKEYQQALGLGHKALDINISFNGPEHMFVAQNHVLLGNIYKDDGALEKAIEHYQLALGINQRAGRERSVTMALTYQGLGEVYNKLGDYEKALQSIQKALISVSGNFDNLNLQSNPSVADVPYPYEMISVLGLKGITFYRLYLTSQQEKYLPMSFDALQLAVELIDDVRVSYRSEGSLEVFREKVNPVFKSVVEVAYELYHKTNQATYLEQAFVFTEKSKASLLMSALQESKAQKFAGIPDALLQEEKRLKQDLNFYEQQLFEERQKHENGDSVKIAFYQNEKFSLRRSYDTLVSKLETEYVDYYQLKYNTDVVNISKVQADLLSADDALIEYFIGDSSIFIFALNKGETAFVKVKKKPQFEEELASFRDIITQKKEDPDHMASLAHTLYRSVLSPIAKHIQGRNLIISPDGELGYLPFGLLTKSEAAAGTGFVKLPYLLKDHQISYIYSLWQEVLSKRGTEASPNQYLALAPDFNKREETEGGETPLLAMNPPVRGSLVELEGTVKEVANINRLFKGKYFEGPDATEQRFKNLAADYGIIHLATHAIVDDENPMNSRLLFTLNQDSTEDGDLYAWELYNLQLNAEMVVLSACNTGFGKLQQGEGVKSLGWAFTHAGCRGIVMSLWPAQDQSTADLMTYFYEGLSKGYSKDRALQEAKLKYLENAGELFAHPFNWAGFVVQGDSGPLASHSNRAYLWLALGLLLGGVLLFLFYRKRKNDRQAS